MKYQIRILETSQEMHAVEELQDIIWPGSKIGIVPSHLLMTLAKNGSVIIGAYPPKNSPEEKRLIGFVYGFPGREESQDGPIFKYCSHQMGVHPAYRGQGIGFMLKLAQRQEARNQGYQRITWTYDPLLSRNGYLNIHKLGAVCKTYQRDFYGQLQDGLNAGLATDRFEVDWWLNSDWGSERLPGEGVPIINPAHATSGRWPAPGDTRQEDAGGTQILVEIPLDFQSLKADDPNLALAWRLHTRAIFEEAFASGYVVTDFVRTTAPRSRSFYLCTQEKNL